MVKNIYEDYLDSIRTIYQSLHNLVGRKIFVHYSNPFDFDKIRPYYIGNILSVTNKFVCVELLYPENNRIKECINFDDIYNQNIKIVLDN